MKLWGIGDVHLNTSKPWTAEAGDRFVDWLRSFDFGKREETEVAFTGDVLDKDTMTGTVAAQLQGLFDACHDKFSRTYVAMGNHELKRRNDRLQHPLMSVMNRDDVEVVTKETAITTPLGFRVLFLPFQKDVEGYARVERYYDEERPLFDGEYDAIVAHVAKKDAFFYKDDVDVSSIKTRAWFLGHIHFRDDPDYLGSVYPNNALEENSKYPRCVKWVSENSTGEVPLPRFMRFAELKYPKEEARPDPSCVTAFAVLDCPNVALARERYPGVHVYKVVREKKKESVQVERAEKAFASYTDGWKDWYSSNKDKVNRRVYNIVSKVLDGK